MLGDEGLSVDLQARFAKHLARGDSVGGTEQLDESFVGVDGVDMVRALTVYPRPAHQRHLASARRGLHSRGCDSHPHGFGLLRLKYSTAHPVMSMAKIPEITMTVLPSWVSREFAAFGMPGECWSCTC